MRTTGRLTFISRTGRKYRRERQMGLGPLHTVGLADAREMAREARLLVRQGKDPLDAKHETQAAAQIAQAKRRTFGEVAEAYLQKFEDGWKNAQHRMQWRGTLRTYILPVLGKLDVEVIDTTAVLQVLEPKLAKRNKARTVRHLAALPYIEMGAFMATLRAVNSIPARALELTILCATRTNETLGARWDEVDLEARLWIIPAIRTKRDREHRVPLSDAAVSVMRTVAAIRYDDRVFPVGKEAMRTCLSEMRPDITVHGFRATFRSWAGGCTTHPRDVCETALGHSIGNLAEQAYQRDALVAKRRVLMADWAEFCAGDRAANVVRMDGRRQRPAPQTDDQSAIVGGIEFPNSESPAASR